MSHPALRIRVPLFSVPILWIFGGASFGATTDNNSKADNMTAPAAGRVVNVTALEANGQSVLDLVISDFRIFEDDKPRPIANFTPLINPRNKNSTPPTTLILFDLLNAFIATRELRDVDFACSATSRREQHNLLIPANQPRRPPRCA